ncbi:hypothetical protein SKAU_G00112070 [Synaphobranchus kaupii]|uniref:Uncharacterized protein n=1 Tax=Synaphobranchus kaupii TaxID=118154 RepID=A0A9Q1J870_SYNKA|nr:hypothetical protein SKAU_G00112070 [Synaphobranchus kaupii]
MVAIWSGIVLTFWLTYLNFLPQILLNFVKFLNGQHQGNVTNNKLGGPMWWNSTLLPTKERLANSAGTLMGNLSEFWNLVPTEWLVMGSLIMFSVNCVALLVFKTRKHQRTNKELDQKLLKLQREVNSASAMNPLYEDLKATFHQLQQESIEQAEVNCETTEAERQRSKTMFGNLKHELTLVLDICKRKEQRLVAMTHRSEIWEEEWAEVLVKELSATEGRCERKERELRAMVELFQEQEDRLGAMAFSLQEKEEKKAGLKQFCQEKAENVAALKKLCYEKHMTLAAFSATSLQQEAFLHEKITEELAQQMESNKLKERVSVLEGEMEENNIILMAQEEEQRETASLRKKLTEISSELADLKRSATNSTYSHPTAQGIIAVEGECMSQNKRASEGHGKEADSVVEREGSELEGSRQQDIAQNQKPAQEGVHGMQAGGETQTNQGGAQEVLHEGQQTTQHSGQTPVCGREDDSGGMAGGGRRGRGGARNRRPRRQWRH